MLWPRCCKENRALVSWWGGFLCITLFAWITLNGFAYSSCLKCDFQTLLIIFRGEITSLITSGWLLFKHKLWYCSVSVSSIPFLSPFPFPFFFLFCDHEYFQEKAFLVVISLSPYFYLARIKWSKVLGFLTSVFCLEGAMKQWLQTAVNIDRVSELSLAQSLLWRLERLLLFLLSLHSIAKGKVCMC